MKSDIHPVRPDGWWWMETLTNLQNWYEIKMEKSLQMWSQVIGLVFCYLRFTIEK